MRAMTLFLLNVADIILKKMEENVYNQRDIALSILKMTHFRNMWGFMNNMFEIMSSYY